MDALFDHRRYLIPFRSSLLPQIFTDTLVIGGGVAGARAAVEAARHGEVIVLAKGELSASNTAWAQGGIAGVMEEGDTPAKLDNPSFERNSNGAAVEAKEQQRRNNRTGTSAGWCRTSAAGQLGR